MKDLSRNVEKSYFLKCARSLIRVFVVRMKKLCITGHPKCAPVKILIRLQSDLSLRWAPMFDLALVKSFKITQKVIIGCTLIIMFHHHFPLVSRKSRKYVSRFWNKPVEKSLIKGIALWTKNIFTSFNFILLYVMTAFGRHKFYMHLLSWFLFLEKKKGPKHGNYEPRRQ